MNARGNPKKNTKGWADNRAETFDERGLGASCDPPGKIAKVYPPLRLTLLSGIVCLTSVADQLTKWIVISSMHLHESIRLIPGILSITRIHNSGIAFGLFPGIPNLFLVVTIISMLVVIYFYLTAHPRRWPLTVGCALILGGALGNLLDRIRLGYVVDFINFSFWPAFNIADSSVTIGVALLLASFLFEKKGLTEDASHPV